MSYIAVTEIEKEKEKNGLSEIIRTCIDVFEKRSGCQVYGLRIERMSSASGSSFVSRVEIEVEI